MIGLKKTEKIYYHHNHAQHLRHLQQARSTIDNTPPRVSLPSKMKVLNFHRMHRIETDNRIMVQKLLQIAQSGPEEFEKDGYRRWNEVVRRRGVRERRVFRQWEVITEN